MSTGTKSPDDSRARATKLAINRDTHLLLGKLDRLLEGIPAKLAPLIVAEPHVAKQQAIIDHEFRRVRLDIEAAMQECIERGADA